MPHLDEGTIHAWLDGQLPPKEAQAAETHVAECRECADAVAEARGLIAASSRILMALDSVPGDVVPRTTASSPLPNVIPETRPIEVMPSGTKTTASAAKQRATRRWFGGAPLAAAAAIVVAIGTVTLWRAGSRDGASEVSVGVDARSGPSADSGSPTVVAAPAVPPSVAEAASAFVRSRDGKTLADVAAEASAGAGARREGYSSAATEPAKVKASAPQELARRPQVVAPSPSPAPAPSSRLAIASPMVTDERRARDQLSSAKDSSPAVAPLAGRVAAANAAVAREKKAEESELAKRADAQSALGGIRGRVTDANNTGIADAMVTVVGTAIGVTTAADGTFDLSGVPAGPQRLVVRRIGYGDSSRDVAVGASQAATANIVMTPAVLALDNVVVTGATGQQSRAPAPAQAKSVDRQRAASPAPPSDAPPGAAVSAVQSNAVGCYELGITPTGAASRTGFREVPRRLSLDNEIVPANAEGIWYRARDLAPTGATPNGLWRPAGQDGLELEWTYGSRTARVRLNGQPTAMMRGSLEEVDRATGTGQAAAVVAVRRACGG